MRARSNLVKTDVIPIIVLILIFKYLNWRGKERRESVKNIRVMW